MNLYSCKRMENILGSIKTFKDFIIEYDMTAVHKSKIASARRNADHSKEVEDKISTSMMGNTNRVGSKHSQNTKNKIGTKRSSYDPIGNKAWMVNSKNQTIRSTSVRKGFKNHKRIY